MSTTVIPEQVAKRAIFTQEFKSVIESRNIFSRVSTTLVSRAKNIQSPYTAVGVAKAYTTDCVVPLATNTLSRDELVLDRNIGNAITDCRESLSYADFDITSMYRADLYSSVLKKFNTEAGADFLADSTTVGGTVTLNSTATVANFLISVAAAAQHSAVGLSQKVDGATVKRGDWHGRPFVIAGNTAYVAIVSYIQSLVAQSTVGNGLASGNWVETPYGVLVINATGVFADEKQMIYGTGGALTVAYRDDLIETDMGETVSIGTYAGASADLDLDPSDPILEKTWYMYAKTKGKNGIYTNVQPLISKQKMA